MHTLQKLSDAEIISKITGVKLEIIIKLLKENNFSLVSLFKQKPEQLKRKGLNIGAEKLEMLKEFSIRYFKEENNNVFKSIKSSLECYDIFKPFFIDKDYELFYVLYLNIANKPIKIECHSQGGITGTVIDVKLIAKNALLYGATGVILAHNHPGQNNKPSSQDIKITTKIKEGLNLFDILLLDHIIYCGSNYFSFTDEGTIY
jgi:DNA repair protein RadC